MKENVRKNLIDLEKYLTDGRLTAEPNGIKYRNKEMIEKFKELGRPLTEEEVIEFIVLNVERNGVLNDDN